LYHPIYLWDFPSEMKLIQLLPLFPAVNSLDKLIKKNNVGKVHSNKNVNILLMHFSAYLLGFNVHLFLDD
jgi:hypothetical protein